MGSSFHIALKHMHNIWTKMEVHEQFHVFSGCPFADFNRGCKILIAAAVKEPFWTGCVSADNETLRWHKDNQLPLFSWSLRTRGFFTGLFTPDTPEVRDNTDLVRVLYNDDNWERLAEEKGVTAIQIALAYVLNQPFPTCALIGALSSAELSSCDEGSLLKLTRAEMDWLDLTRDAEHT